MLNGGTLNYFAVPWAVIGNPLPLVAVTAIEVVLMGAVERFRQQGQGPPGYSPGVGKFDEDIFNGLDDLYPGQSHLLTHTLHYRGRAEDIPPLMQST